MSIRKYKCKRCEHITETRATVQFLKCSNRKCRASLSRRHQLE